MSGMTGGTPRAPAFGVRPTQATRPLAGEAIPARTPLWPGVRGRGARATYRIQMRWRAFRRLWADEWHRNEMLTVAAILITIPACGVLAALVGAAMYGT